MPRVVPGRAAMIGCALALLLALPACGGGGSSSTEAAATAVSPIEADASADATQAHAPDTSAPPAEVPPAEASSTAPQAPPGDVQLADARPASGAAAADDAAVSGSAALRQLLQNNQFQSGPANWSLNYAATVQSELRPGGKALSVQWKVTQAFPAGTFVPGKSYRLIVKARNDKDGGNTQLIVRFRKVQYSEAIRTYATAVTSTEWRDYTVEFTAPPYADMADFAIEAKDARALVDSTSLTERTPIAQTEPIASTANSYVPAGYTLVFNDEFNGTTLNRQKWLTRYIYNGGTSDHLNDERQHYRDNDNHVLKDGVLSLVARKVANKYDGYESGMIRSDFTMTYGYLEARVKMPGGKGVWAAFWLNSDVSGQGRLNWPPEFDIFEYVYNGAEDKLNMLHSNVVRQTKDTQIPLTYNDPAFNTNINDYVAPFNFNEGFHTVGTEWTPEGVTVYVDGLKLYTRKYSWVYGDGVAAGPAHILLNLAIGGSWAGRHGIDDSAFPQALQIDWVRAYQKK